MMDDAEIWDAFQAGTLTHAQWNHRSHLRIACLHARQHNIDEAHLRLRAGIIRLNQRHGLVETGDRGYFETLTRAWLVLVAAALHETKARTTDELLALRPELLDRERVRRHYSKELLDSVRARAIFVAPDLHALPDVR